MEALENQKNGLNLLAGGVLGSRDTKAHSWMILRRRGFVASGEMAIFPSANLWIT